MEGKTRGRVSSCNKDEGAGSHAGCGCARAVWMRRLTRRVCSRDSAGTASRHASLLGGGVAIVGGEKTR